MQSETKPEGGVARVGVATWNTVVHLCAINSPYLRTQVMLRCVPAFQHEYESSVHCLAAASLPRGLETRSAC